MLGVIIFQKLTAIATIALFSILLLGFTPSSRSAAAEVPAADHQALLDRLSPVLRLNSQRDLTKMKGGEPTFENPVSMSWYVQYTDLVKRRVGGRAEEVPVPDEAGSEVQSGEHLVEMLKTHWEPDVGMRIRLRREYRGDAENYLRWGWTPDGSRAGDKRIYGAVFPAEGDLVRVAYFAFWPYSQAEVGAANHAGDWICVEFSVDVSDPDRLEIERAIYHNHGRKIVIDDAANNLTFVKGHPVVWIEDTTHEPWPISGGEGFADRARHPPGGMGGHIASKREAWSTES